MINKFARPVAGGLLSGLMLGALMIGIPGAMLFLYAIPLPLYLAGLSRGTTACAVAVGAGSLAATAIGGIAVSGPFLAMFGLPAVVVVWRALSQKMAVSENRELCPIGQILGWLTLLAVAGILAAALLAAGSEGGLEGQIRQMLPKALALVFDGPMPEELAPQIDQLVRLFPAMLAMMWIIMTALNAALAQIVLTRRGRAARPSPIWLAVEAPAWTPYAFSAAVILGAVGPDSLQFIGENLAPALAMPYFFVGLAVVHSLVRRLSARTLVLVIFYMLLILLGIFAMVLVAALGFAEMWLGLRRRGSAPGRS